MSHNVYIKKQNNFSTQKTYNNKRKNMKKIFEVCTNLTVQKNSEFIQNLNDEDRQQILDLDLDLGVDVVKEDIITSYIICNDLNIEKMKELLKKHEIEYEVSDVTSQVVSDAKPIDKILEEDILLIFDKNK
jgi:hypothetical protein